MPTTPLRYRIGLERRRQHLVDVTLVVPADLAGGARIVMPTWTPGSYVVRDYVHHVQQIEARLPDGTPVALHPDGHTAWRLPDGVADAVGVHLELYANDLTVRTNHVDDHHALLVGAATFPYVEGAEERRHEVAFDDVAEPVWSLLPEEDGSHVAEDLDHLVDCAFEVGDHPVATYSVGGVEHRFVYAAHGGHPDLDRIAHDAEAIGEAAVELFDGELPVDRYTFLHVGWNEGGGGLEHRDGAVLMMPVLAFQSPDDYARFQALLAHEYLHLWNVKRLVPAELGELRYDAPVHTTSLWVAEGWTAFYDELLPLRAGLWSVKRYLEHLRDNLAQVTETPGAALQSVEEASYHAWTGLYVRDENWRNKGVNYYGHGALLAWCLDLTIRQQQPDGPGLDGALRALWREFGGRGGYGPDDVVRAVSDAAGRDLGGFFDRHVRGRQVPPVEELVDVVGLRLVDETPADDDAAPPPPDLGVETSEDDQGVTLTTVLRGRPAWHGGLTGGDRLLAIDGLRVGRGQLDTVLRAHDPGAKVEVAVFRGPRLLTVPVTLGEPRPKRKLTRVADPDESQRTAFRRWTGRDLGTVGAS